MSAPAPKLATYACMRLCFCLDGYASQVGVAVRQEAAGRIIGTVTNMTGQRAPVSAVAHQVARVLSLDRDARGYVELVERDRRLASLAADDATDVAIQHINQECAPS